MPPTLSGLRVVELGSIGPGPHTALLLANLGADIIRIDRPTPGFTHIDPDTDDVLRGRPTACADLRDPTQLAQVLDLVAHADVFIEGFRPGVAERLGIGPEECMAVNPRLVYARITGWGQEGPLALTAGHDINYLAMSGALHCFARDGRPPMPPLNLLADFAGGSMLAVQGVLAALYERERSGRGQTVDVAMIDGVNSLMAWYWAMAENNAWFEPGRNMIDGAAPFYNTYTCSDGQYIAVGAVETPFFRALLRGLGLPDELTATQHDESTWPDLVERFAALFAERTRDEWVARFDGLDACVSPVLTLDEAAEHSHSTERGSIETRWGRRQPRPAPRFSRSSLPNPTPPGIRESLTTLLDRWTD